MKGDSVGIVRASFKGDRNKGVVKSLWTQLLYARRMLNKNQLSLPVVICAVENAESVII